MSRYLFLIMVLFWVSCAEKKQPKRFVQPVKYVSNTSLVILGNVQDAGSPQIACKKECCKDLFEHADPDRMVSSLGLIDVDSGKTYLFDASPDIAKQMKLLTKMETRNDKDVVDAIFLTHAHIGHYTGLMYLGKEAMDAQGVATYVMPRMKTFLSDNGPWSQLISRQNIVLHEMENDKPVMLSNNIKVVPILVPHRDEFSETVGYRIYGPRNSALFIPDIDKWSKWGLDIVQEVKSVDYAFLDATFYSGKEMDNRDISQIPHPFVIESFETFHALSKKEKNKIVFIHFNHTNPLLDIDGEEVQAVIDKGFRIGRVGDIFAM